MLSVYLELSSVLAMAELAGCFHAMTKTQIQGRAKHTRCMHDDNGLVPQTQHRLMEDW